MKKIYKFLLVTVVISSFTFYSCETLKLEDLASPNSLSSNDADPDLMLNSIQLAYNSSQRTFQLNGAALGRIDYMFGKNYLNNFGSGTANGPWNNLYSSMLTNSRAIEVINAANADKDYSFHIAVSKTLEAHILMQLVDYLGDIPWSEAGKPNEFPTPNADDDAAVYTAALALLSEAKSLFGSTSGAGTATDLFYGGDTAKWIKLVNTLQMRADLTVGNYAAVVAATNVISSTADDFEFSYGSNVLSPDTRHPDYAADYTSSGANLRMSSWLISKMVGTFGDFSASTDPRRRYYYYRQSWRTPGGTSLFRDINGAFGAPGNVYTSTGGPSAEFLSCTIETVPTHYEFTPDEVYWCSLHLGYWARIHGDDKGSGPDGDKITAAGVYPAGGSFDWREDAFPYVGLSPTATFGQQVNLGNGGGGAGIQPIYLASYVDFMKAEANLALGNTAVAATLIQSGLTKSIAKVMSFASLDGAADMSQAPSAATVTGFITDRVAEFNAAPLTTALDGTGWPIAKDKMDILGEQYFITIFGGGADAYNFIRRTGHPRTLARNIEPSPGSFPRTVLYPSSEVSTNPNILQRTDQTTTVFWDAGVTNPAN